MEKSELENLDKDVRKLVTMNKGFSKHSDVDRLFLQRRNGGRGLFCMKDFYDKMCVCVNSRLYNESHNCPWKNYKGTRYA